MSVDATITTPKPKKKKKRIFYLDALRALAIISVILFHIFMQTRGIVAKYYGTPSLNWWIVDILGACFRCGVDIFLMLSGALSLGRVWDIKTFLGKRLPRIAMPFVFWGVVLSIAMVLISMFWLPKIHTLDTFNIVNFFQYLFNSFMSKNPGFTQFWFFWMILGTYLIMPILNKWLYNCDMSEVEYFLVIWIVTCLFDYTIMTPFPIKLTYFTGPIGMVVLGYYLRHTKRKIFNNPYYSLLFLIVGAAMLIFASYCLSSPKEVVFLERYSVLYAIEVIGIFTLFKNASKFNIHIKFLENPDGIFRKGIFSIAKYSYGIYLVHRAILVVIYVALLHVVKFRPHLLLMFVGTLGISWIIMALLNRIPYVNQVIGAK